MVIGGAKSSIKSVTSGVPQCSILGPLLFVLFINDMYECMSFDTQIALYADDTKIWRRINSFNDHEAIQKDIDTLLKWSLTNKMTYHPQKCKVLSVTLENRQCILPFDRFPYCRGGSGTTWLERMPDSVQGGV